MHLKELKKKTSAELVEMAEEYGVESASTLRRQDLMYAILKEVAEDGEEIIGQGTIEVLPDGFGFLRNPEANYLAGPDDIYVSPNQVRKWGLRTGDTVEGEIRAPRMASAISRSPSWSASISTIPKRCAIASTSTT